MTRKHFEVIASILAETKPANNTGKQHEVWESIVGKFGTELQEQNDKFDLLRFFARCNGIKP